ncbi:hypothetical protein ACFUIZ_31185 [Streptomyces cinereoruber]|uniref:hypothetical protein n=1 Tax=Streptomyces cinereoruber TaxID=67260 RepID=UPI00363B64B6
MSADPYAAALLTVLCVALVCAVIVCTTAVLRAHRSDVVAVVWVLSEPAVMLMRWRLRW